jgi:hypothetical protein
MHADESNDSRPADAAGVHATAIDVHNHAMLPLLEWLERAGLSDLSRIGDGVVLLDPAVGSRHLLAVGKTWLRVAACRKFRVVDQSHWPTKLRDLQSMGA